MTSRRSNYRSKLRIKAISYNHIWVKQIVIEALKIDNEVNTKSYQCRLQELLVVWVLKEVARVLWTTSTSEIIQLFQAPTGKTFMLWIYDTLLMFLILMGQRLIIEICHRENMKKLTDKVPTLEQQTDAFLTCNPCYRAYLMGDQVLHSHLET